MRTFLSLPLVLLLLSQCVVGCCRPRRGDLLPCCTVLCWWRRRVQCQGHLSDKQSRCLTLTNSPAGLGPPSRQSSAATSTQSAETCSCCSKDSVPLPLTTAASMESTPAGLTFICLWKAAASVTCSFGASYDCIFGHGQKAIVNMQLVFIYTKGLLSEAYPDI